MSAWERVGITSIRSRDQAIDQKDKGHILRRVSFCWLAVLCVIVLFGASSSANAAEGGSAKRVLIISTGSRFSAGFAVAHERILEALGKISAVWIEAYAGGEELIRAHMLQELSAAKRNATWV